VATGGNDNSDHLHAPRLAARTGSFPAPSTAAGPTCFAPERYFAANSRYRPVLGKVVRISALMQYSLKTIFLIHPAKAVQRDNASTSRLLRETHAPYPTLRTLGGLSEPPGQSSFFDINHHVIVKFGTGSQLGL
jgi:hypothetical protein